MYSSRTRSSDGSASQHQGSAVAIPRNSREIQSLYNSKQWKARRAAQLSEHPLCVMCLHQQRIERATVADHVIPHRGDKELFYFGELQSLCENHHNSSKKRIEQKGFTNHIGHDGWPMDPQHPANRKGVLLERHQHERNVDIDAFELRKPEPRMPFSIPRGLKRSAIPVHIVCGPPGAGKTTFVKQNAKIPPDLIIDLDDIREELCGERYSNNPTVLQAAFAERNKRLHTLHHRTEGQAWLILLAPTQEERAAWLAVLGKQGTLHQLNAPAHVCLQRVLNDETRKGYHHRLSQAIDEYFKRAT